MIDRKYGSYGEAKIQIVKSDNLYFVMLRVSLIPPLLYPRNFYRILGNQRFINIEVL